MSLSHVTFLTYVEILSATRTPPAPSIIQFRGGRYWFQLGKHTPQRTARADPPIPKMICSRGQFHKVSCNSIQQTDKKADCRHHGNVTAMANYTTDGTT
jgi:hypothetical protein